MWLVTMIDEHICCNGVKVQKWQSIDGWDIVIMKDGVVQSTTLASNITQANALFLQKIRDIECGALLLSPLNQKALCVNGFVVEMTIFRKKYRIKTYLNDKVISTISVDEFKDALSHYRSKIEEYQFLRIL